MAIRKNRHENRAEKNRPPPTKDKIFSRGQNNTDLAAAQQGEYAPFSKHPVGLYESSGSQQPRLAKMMGAATAQATNS
jgi:hypothetical protein